MGPDTDTVDADPTVDLTVEATHEQSLVGRLAVLLNAHEVTAFVYRTDPQRHLATVEVSVAGGELQVERAAHRLRRVIGVHRVTTRDHAYFGEVSVSTQ